MKKNEKLKRGQSEFTENLKQDQFIRDELEKAYEEEKNKKVITQRCSRIYHDILKREDNELYQHLMENEVSPELQLMRWLRCAITRELEPDMCIMCWDYILGGIFL